MVLIPHNKCQLGRKLKECKIFIYFQAITETGVYSLDFRVLIIGIIFMDNFSYRAMIYNLRSLFYWNGNPTVVIRGLFNCCGKVQLKYAALPTRTVFFNCIFAILERKLIKWRFKFQMILKLE